MRAFVTGAASPLGRALVSALTRRGHRVVGLVRRRNGVALMENLKAQPVVGDLTNPEVLVKAMKGCDVVFHVANFFDLWARKPQVFDTVNVDGTKNTLAAAVVAKVPRAVYVSSCVTIGEFPGQLGNEWTHHRGWTISHFERTKVAAEKTALKLRAKGIEVIVVNPGIIVGPADPGWCGRMISETLTGQRRFAGNAPVGWIWAYDAAEAIILAFERGKDGERYILSGETMSPRQFLTKVARLAGKRPPLPLPRKLAMPSAYVATAVAAALGKRPILSIDEARFTSIGFRADGTHAQHELGVQYTPISKYLPLVVESYKKGLTRFAS
jgi:dihydroflavonol-4-reductase